MSDRPDAYKVLQVDPEADPEVIQAAYRRLAQKFHPDRAGGPDTPAGREAARRMVAINAAWELLGDEHRRAAYDRERGATATRAAVAPMPDDGRADAGTRAGTTAHPDRAERSGGASSAPNRLAFGRYAGWRLEDILRSDPGYLEWLDRTPAGRPYRGEIDALLRRIGRRSSRTEGTGGLPRR